MLTNFLEKSRPINFIIFLGLFFLFFLISFYKVYLTVDFTWLSLLIESFSFIFLFLLFFFYYNFIVSKNNLTLDNTYAFFLFTLTSILFLHKLLDLKTLTLLVIHLFFLRKIYSLRSFTNIISKLFDCGFWLGILYIIEPFFILFFILVFASILLQQKTTIYNIFTPLIGFVTPLIIYFTYLSYFNISDIFIQPFNFNVTNNFFIYTDNNIIWLFGGILLLTIISIFSKSSSVLYINDSFKKSWLLLIVNLIVSTFFALLVIKKNGSEVIFITIPATIIIANGLEIIPQKKTRNIFLALLIFSTVLLFFLAL